MGVRRVRSRRWHSSTRPVPIGWALGGVLAVGLAATAGLGALAWWAIGAPPLPASASQAQVLLEAIRIALLVVGGIGGVIALVVAYRRQRITEIAEAREGTKLLEERFVAAVELLGNENPAIALGGVHAMAGLADDWDEFEGQQKCIDVLCSYLRSRTLSTSRYAPGPTPSSPDEPTLGTENAGDREVRHTILRTIAAHLRPGSRSVSWEGHSVDLRTVTIDVDLSLDGARLGDEVVLDLTGARFRSGQVSFDRCRLEGGSILLRGCVVEGGALSFDDLALDRGRVELVDAELELGRISFDRARCTGGAIDCSGLQMTGGTFSCDSVLLADAATLSFVGARFDGGTLDFRRARFRVPVVSFAEAEFASGTVRFDGAGLADVRGQSFVTSGLRFDAARFDGTAVSFAEAEFVFLASPPPGRPPPGYERPRVRAALDFSGAEFGAARISFQGVREGRPIGLPAALEERWFGKAEDVTT